MVMETRSLNAPTLGVRTDTEQLLTVQEVARRLRVDDTTVRRWITQGSLEAVTLPHVGKRQTYRICQSTLNVRLTQPLVER